MASRSSTNSRRRPLPETVAVGEVRRPHGVRGEVAVEVLSDVPGRLAPGNEVLAVSADGRRRTLRVAGRRPHRGGVLVTFEGVADRDGAEALRGATLEVARSTVPAAPAGTYYHFELLGCRCADREAGELGEVVDLVEDGGGLILVVRGERGEVPVPFVRRFIRSIDVAAGVIELELPEGLVETCASRS
jgi:16S rRNA processing protein RimM